MRRRLFSYLRERHSRSVLGEDGGRVFGWRPKKEEFVKRPSPVFFVFLIAIFLISQFSIFSKASEAAQITKTSTADWNLGTNSNVSTASNEVKLSPTYSSWYNASWKYRRKVTIDYTKVSADQTDFPVLIKITGAIDPIFTNAQADGDDILFTSSDEITKLPHEIEKFDTTSKELWAWVKAPALSASVNTVLYLYYGYADATNQQDAVNVWTNGYYSAWHLPNGTTLSANDSTSNAKNGTVSNATATSGQIDGAGLFNGSTSSISAASIDLSSTSAITISGWLKWTTYAANDKLAFEHTPNMNNSTGGFIIDPNSSTQATQFEITTKGDVGLNGAFFTRPTAGNWHYYSIVLDKSQAAATEVVPYVDGNAVAYTKGTYSSENTNAFANSTSYFMSRAGSSLFGAGSLDDLRISTGTRSATWISTEYNNQNAPETFATVEAQKSYYPIYDSTSWYSTGGTWSARQKITIDHTKVSTNDQTDFPVLVRINDQSNPLFTTAQSDGDDILFTSSNGTTKLSHDLERFSATSSKEMIAWIKIPTLSSSADTVLFMYYGNASSGDMRDKTGVWSNGYAMVQHMNDSTTSSIVDSTSSSITGSKIGITHPAETPGKIGKGQDFNGAGDYISFPPVSNFVFGTGGFTTNAWIKYDTDPMYVTISESRSADGGDGFHLGINANGSNPDKFHLRIGGANYVGSTTYSAGSWYRVTVRGNSTSIKVYINGALEITVNTNYNLTSNLYLLGTYNGRNNFWWDGVIDELNISSSARADSWIATEYNNQNNPWTFSYISAEQQILHGYISPTSIAGGSGILDTYYNLGWGTPNGFAATVTVPTNTSIIFTARSSSVGGSTDGDWTSWQTLGTATTSGVFSVATASMPAGLTTGANHYLQLKSSLNSTDGLNTPTLSDYTFYYLADVGAPTNPTTTTAALGGNPLTSGTWTNTAGTVNFTFSGATDTETGVAGYYTYLGTSAVGDPATYQAHVGAGGDNQTFSGAIADGGNYYFRIKTKDGGGNIASAVTLFTIGCDTTAPVKPSYITADPAGYTADNSFDFTWPTGSDTGSGVQYYEYKRATDVAWTQTTGPADRSALNLEAYQEGANAFYVRTVDNADNPSSTYTQVTYYWSGNAPPKPDNVAVDPTSNDENSFTISWDKPNVEAGSPIVGYYYSINTPPTLTNTTYVASTASHVSVGPDKYATIQGENTVYVVSKNETGNSSFLPAYYSTATFNCQTSAPPAPTSVSIYDSSDKVEPRYMLTIQWQAGTGQNAATFDHYSVERSTDGTNYSELATVSTGTSYLDDSNLSDQTTYYYRIKSVDNAGSSSAASSIVSKQPSGRYTTPPAILSAPAVDAKATQATITWTTNRASSSFVRYGTVEGQFEESRGDFAAATNHSVTLLGLSGSSKYYFQVQSVDVDRDYTLESAYSTTYSFITLTKPSISNVSVSSIALTSADISWDTTTVASSKLNYGKTTSYGTTVEDISGQSSTKHATKIANLDNSTSYHFKIVSTDIDGIELTSEDYSFETLPLPKISNLKVEEITGRPSQMVKVQWETNVPTSTIVRYSAGSEKAKEKVKSHLEKNHEVESDGLSDDSAYSIIAEGTDQFGNTVTSEAQIFKTKYDTRKVIISDIQVESNNVGQIRSEFSQMVISWKTDEPATSQVLYGKGLSGETTSKSLEDTELKTDHLVILGDLESNVAYSFKAVSKDKSGNETVSDNQIIVAGETKMSTLRKIFNALYNLFGKWMKI